jgi:hypothetical protein
MRYAFGFFAACSLFLLPLVTKGYFKNQAQLKIARHLIETQGYAYCAIWGDGTDPFQLMAMNSPNHPNWRGQRQPDGTYLMTFTYRRSGKGYQHQWQVNLAEKRVETLSERTRTPLSVNETEHACSDR